MKPSYYIYGPINTFLLPSDGFFFLFLSPLIKFSSHVVFSLSLSRNSNPDFDWKFLGETWRVAATAYDDELFAQSFYGSGGAGNVYGYGVPPSLVYAPLLFSK